MIPKILIACPTSISKDYVLDRWAERVSNLKYDHDFYDVLVIDNTRLKERNGYSRKIASYGIKVLHPVKDFKDPLDRIYYSSELIRKHFLEGRWEYLLMLEQDVIPPEDVLQRLLFWDKEVVSGWYYINQKSMWKRPCVLGEWKENGHLTDMHETLCQNRLVKVTMGSFGCCLIKRNVLERISFKKYAKFLGCSVDTVFYHDLETQGIGAYVDSDLLVPHFQSSWYSKEHYEELKNQEVKKYKTVMQNAR